MTPRAVPRRSFSCFVRGIPAPKGSKNAFITGGHAVVVDKNSKALRSWEAAVRGVLQDKWEGPPIEGPISIDLNFRLLKPPSVSKKRARPTVRPDLDKLVRAVLDALTGIAFRDDAQVVSIAARKFYDAESGVQVSLAGPVR